ncbi:MAG: UDP-N-acetylmuramoyl-L-alanine--D-glutamate ligase [Candidatus Omnitrophica bacterium]|nr:UDP-N-acetylmuramoyl-L-alanine--D-glutamate ligase [Candidatus Omnitrophota bacterium]
MDLKGKTVTIIGAARSGLAAANLVMELGGKVKITDAKPRQEFEKDLVAIRDLSRVEIESGGHTREFVLKSDLVVASPGVWRDAEPLAWAREAGIPVWGEIEFAWRFCRKPVIAVTGSNGKTTTVTLISKVIEAAGKKVCLCGNVGTPFSAHVLKDVDYFVVEISSFQLELIETFRPFIAVLLNFSQNHLDRHPDMQDYFNAKARLFMNQASSDFAVLNSRDEWSKKAADKTRARVRFFNKPGETRNPNHLAVLEVARILGIADTVANKVFDSFRGVEHRLEKVRVLDGVTYINDSKSTTVEAGRWALSTMTKPVILIAGGHDKGADYSVLREMVKLKVKKLFVLTKEDTTRGKFHKAFDGAAALADYTDMAEAVSAARKEALSGETVLLSPMCASFDMFDNFEHRGRVFKEIVNNL